MVRCLAAALLLAAPMSASAQLKPSQPQGVADAVGDCWAAVGAGGVDTNVLARSGWKAGSIKDPQGVQVDTPLQVYGKTASDVVLMLMRTGDRPACTIISRVGTAADVSLAAQAVQRRLTAADPHVKTARSGKSIAFLALPKLAMLDAAGTQAQPSVRVVVAYQVPGKK